MTKRYFVLVHDQARAGAIQAIKDAPDGHTVLIDEPKRNLPQNAKIHTALTEYGRRINWIFGGRAVDLADLKLIFMDCYNRIKKQESRFVLGLDGYPVDLSRKTSDLKKPDCIEFIELIEAYLNGGDV